jgi:hypothetical protein
MSKEFILNTNNTLRSLNLNVVIPLCCSKQVYHVYMYCIRVYVIYNTNTQSIIPNNFVTENNTSLMDIV